MIRKDGTYTFYKIQHLQKDGWVYSNFDVFCKNLDFRDDPYRSFTAVGECWQETGEQACYDIFTSLLFLKQISELWPNFQFRLVKVQVMQKTKKVKIQTPCEMCECLNCNGPWAGDNCLIEPERCNTCGPNFKNWSLNRCHLLQIETVRWKVKPKHIAKGSE